MLKVLHVIETLGIGGAEKQLAKTLPYISRERYDNHAAFLYGSHELRSSLEQQGIPVYSFGLDHRYQWVKGTVKLVKLIKKIQPRILHTYLFNSNIIGRFASAYSRVPLVCTLTGTNYDPVRYECESISKFKHEIVRIVDKITGRLIVDKYTAVTEHVKQSMIERIGLKEEKVEVIPRGLDETWGEGCEGPLSKELSNMVKGRWPVLLNTGRLVEVKGQKYAIEAVSLLQNKYPDILLLVAGEGPLRRELASLAEGMGVRDNVRLLGNRNDMESLLLAADMFLCSSLYEGAANAMVEAAGSGKPCVAFDIPHLRAVASEDFCLFAEFGNSVSLSTAVDRMCSERDAWPEKAEKARRLTRDRHDFHTIARMYEDLYESLLQTVK